MQGLQDLQQLGCLLGEEGRQGQEGQARGGPRLHCPIARHGAAVGGWSQGLSSPPRGPGPWLPGPPCAALTTMVESWMKAKPRFS